MVILIIILLISLNFCLYSKSEKKISKKNETAVFAELGGQGLLLSLNADYKFHPNFSLRAGFSYLLLGFGFPISLNFISDAKSSYHFEADIGILLAEVASLNLYNWSSGAKKFAFFLNSNFSFRYQPPNGGFFFRLSFTPFLNLRKSEILDDRTSESKTKYEAEIKPWLGLSIGYSFNL